MLLFIPKKDLVMLDMTVEEGIKMVVSGGIVTPPDRRTDEQKKIRRVAPAEAERKTIPYQRDATLEAIDDDAEPESKDDKPPKRAA